MKIYDSLKESLENRKAIGAVIGLGYVGLPLVNSMCQNGLKVIAIDIDPKKIETLTAGKSYVGAVSDENISRWIDEGKLFPDSNYSRLAEADFIIICVPTPLDEHLSPDLTYVIETTEKIAKYLKKGHVIVLESTTYPGTMTDIVKPVLDKTGFKEGEDYFLAYSPERENPGSTTHSTSTIPKVIGADNPVSLDLAQKYYEIFIDKMVPVSSMAAAEASKITENIFRSVNIALINELKIIYSKMGIDIWEVIEAMKTKPFGYMPFYPGPGLGGHCIPIDPFYLSWKAKEYGINTRFIELAGEINTAMPNYVVQKTIEALNDIKCKALHGASILISGIAYKKNVADQRETPAFPIMKSLIAKGSKIDFYDPYIPEILPNRAFHELVGLKSIDWEPECFNKYDCIIIVTDHDQVEYKEFVKAGVIIIDTRNVYGNDASNKLIFKA